MNTRLPPLAVPERRAFTMIEMLFVLILLSVFALVATRVTVATLKLLHHAGDHTERTALLDDVAARLRADVTPATRLDAAANTTAAITTPAGEVRWTLTPDTITRTPTAGEEKTWRLQTLNATFTADGPHLLLRSEAGELAFTSESLRLAQRGAK